MIPFSDPDITQSELDALTAAACSTRLSHGPLTEAFEAAFARYAGRKHAVAVSSGLAGMILALKAQGIGVGDEVIASAYSWREVAGAVDLVGAKVVFADIDYWSGVLVPSKITARITGKTKAILAQNANGHPAPWGALRDIADREHLVLLEDSTEALGSCYQGKKVGGFGDCAVFDFSQPGPLCCGEGGMVVTDDEDCFHRLRHLRHHEPHQRASISIGAHLSHQSNLSDLAAALGMAQLERLDGILARRKSIERIYFEHVKSFEGIKDPYVAPEVDVVHWFTYLVHLGTRFTRSSCDAIVEDMRREGIEAYAYCRPWHTQRHAIDSDAAHRRGLLPVTERLADRAVALPFHGHLTEDQIAFIVTTLKDASVNVGAGSAIYL